MKIVAFAIVTFAFLSLESALGKAGALPIANKEIIEGVSGIGNEVSTLKVERQKRQANSIIIRNFIQCTAQSTVNVVINCPTARWNLSCKMRSPAYNYYITCTNMHSQWQCPQRHIINNNHYPVCCDLKCP